MKKGLLLGLTVLMLLLVCSSCVYFDLTPLIGYGFDAMNLGEIDRAEALFRQVIAKTPEQPDANLGLSLVSLFKGNKALMDFSLNNLPTLQTMTSQSKEIRRAQTRLKALALIAKVKSGGLRQVMPELQEIRDLINLTQEELSTIVRWLEEAKRCLGIAIKFAQPREIQPNQFDWNGNGKVEASTPLLLDNTLDNMPVWKLIASYLYFTSSEPGVGQTSRIFDPTGGDAWFDKELFDKILNGEDVDINTWVPTFDETDVVLLGSDELRWLYLLVNAELAILEPSLIYSFDFGEELIGFIDDLLTVEASEGTFAALNWATQTLDTTPDGTITTEEWKPIFADGFLAFRPDDQNGGYNAIADWRSAIVDFCNTAIEMIQDGTIPIPEIIESQLFQGSQFREVLTAKEQVIAALVEVIAFVSDPTKSLQLYPPFVIGPLKPVREVLPLLVQGYPGAFFSYPENFQDLKNFFPDIHYFALEEGGIGIDGIQFSDPTFGDLVEVLIDGVAWDGFFGR